MMWWSGSWGWGAWLAMSLAMVAFWAFVAWVVVTLIRNSGSGGSWFRPGSPEEILDGRFARGELDEDEYRRRRELMSSAR